MDDDAELLWRWHDGDRSAGEELYRRWVGTMTRYFRNKVADDAEVPDLVSQSFFALTQAKARVQETTGFRPLLFGIARKVLHTHLRKRYKRAREADDFGTLCIADVTPHGPSSLMLRERGRQAFLHGLRSLSLDDQILLELRYFEGLTGPELAEIQEVAEGTIRGRIARATARLVSSVHEALGEDADHGDAPRIDDAALDAWARELRVHMGREASG